MGSAWTVAKKEFSTYFSSPIAFIFLATFSAVSLFIFFWVEKFFARNIVDARPLFEWMPVLLIFLSAALTMKMWSEERRMGTLEFLLTMPLKTHQLVLGKFLACLGLVAVALCLTVGVPITVSFMGDLDWGPVWGAYLASLLLAGAYISVGLYISSKNDNQIVSLILTTIVCLLVYLIGSETLSSLVGNRWSEIFKLLATGSRFESITRGILDIRDVYYYVSLSGTFLALNVLSLESLRWSHEGQEQRHRRWRTATALVIANLVVVNGWLYRITAARADLTRGGVYTISDATRNMLVQLREPLTIRGYFSEKTHPLLAPLVPRIRDTIREYSAMSDGKVRAEFVDPREDPELEEEANRQYNIRPIPFQITDRYQSSLVNSYFDVLIQYGDKFEVLRFQDLIEIKPSGNRLDVRLRNLEYDLTRSIKKVLYGFQGIDALFASLNRPVEFQGYISADDKLPRSIVGFKTDLVDLLEELKKNSRDRFRYEIVDPQSNGGALAGQIEQEFGFRPMVAGLFNPQRFYFYMILKSDGNTVQVPLPRDLSREALQRSIEAALKRFSPGFLKTIGFYSPAPPATPHSFMQPPAGGKQFLILQQRLRENYQLESVDLKSGFVPSSVDLLLMAAPEKLDAKQLFAVDQFLMKGGSIVLLTSPYSVTRNQAGLTAVKYESGLEPLLRRYGIEIEEKMVLDSQNSSYPVPVNRRIGGFTVREIQLVPYPYFVDIRGRGLNDESSITSNLPQVTLNWASSLVFREEGDSPITLTWLVKSSENSWVLEGTNLQPDFKRYPRVGFPLEGARKARILGAIVEGVFESYYAGKASPLLQSDSESEKVGGEGSEGRTEDPVLSGTIEKSPESARILLFASNDFLSDETLQITRAAGGERFINALNLVENAVDWALEDRALLSIRSRGHFSRTLIPMTDAQKMFWEYVNYAIVLFGLVFIYACHRAHQGRLRRHYRQILA